MDEIEMAQMRQRFWEDGYLVVRGLFAGWEVERLRRAADGLLVRPAGPLPPEFMPGPDGVGFNRVRDVLRLTLRQDRAFLLALGNPELLGLVAALSRSPAVCLADVLVVKKGGTESGFDVHADWTARVAADLARAGGFNVGIYLDRSTPANGCLKVLPGSHRRWEDLDAYLQGHVRPEAFVAVPVEPGDAIIHHICLLHASAPNTSGEERRTLYFEFHPKAECGAVEWRSGAYVPADEVERRWRLMQTAASLRQAHDAAVSSIGESAP